MWARRFNGAGNGDDAAGDVGTNPDGSMVFITGAGLGSTTGKDYATEAYDGSTGTELWTGPSTYNGPGNGTDSSAALTVSPDGSAVFVTGVSLGTTTDYDYATVAYDASTGAGLWAGASTYNGPGNGFDEATDVAVSPDGSAVFVTGSATISVGVSQYATLAYDATTGADLWGGASLFSSPVPGSDRPRAIAVSPDGSTVFVTGLTLTNGGDYTTVAYNASTGAQVWARRYNGPPSGTDGAAAIVVSPDGSTVFVTGGSKGSTSDNDFATVGYDASTGAKLWASRYNGAGNGADSAHGLAISPDGSRVYVTGFSLGSGSALDYATVAYKASTGAKLWAKTINGPGNGSDFGIALGVSPDGSKVFVTGTSTGATSSTDFATLAYASTGGKLWTKRYNGPGNGEDAAVALVVNPDGSTVVVTGTSVGTTSGKDIATVAYSVT